MKNLSSSDQYTTSINLAGLVGQIMDVPGTRYKNHNMLLVYGHFGTLPNYLPLATELSRYGNVIAPDLPGFNNHQSLYKIHDKPTIDELAEYLTTVVNYRFRKRKMTIVAIGFGAAIVTRMLQRHSSISRKVNIVISIDGMAHHDDLNSLSGTQRRMYSVLFRIFSLRLPSQIIKNTNIPDSLLERVYQVGPKNSKKNAPKVRLIDWHVHDFRTYMRTMSELLRLDNCKIPVNVKLVQVWSGTLTCLDSDVTDQHHQIIFDNFAVITSQQKISKKADSIKQMYKIKLPKQLEKLLLKTARSSVIE